MENILKFFIVWIIFLTFLYEEKLCAQESVEDLGCYGTTFEIIEENMLDYLHNKLRDLEKSGQLTFLREEWKNRIECHLKNPKPVQGIIQATTKRTWTIDPTLTIENDILTPNNEIIALKGQKINPLHYVKPEKGFLFIDELNQSQVEFAKRNIHDFDIVLIQGSPIDLSKKIKAPVFFDQGGYLTSQYGIKAVPAFLSIEDDHLRLTEVPCEQ